MKIPQQYPQFTNQSALIIVTGTHVALFYHAHDGALEALDSFAVENPKYSDREGFFIHSGHGQIFGSGSVYEPKTHVAEQRFIHQLHDTLRTLVDHTTISDIYLFMPKQIGPEILKQLDGDLTKLVRETFDGNYTTEHPNAFLERFKVRQDEAHASFVDHGTSPEAQKILDQTQH